jgi:sporulation protein YlmC with PRC-barrel domain
MKQDYLDMVRQVLDRQVVDADNVPCGKVDDLEIEGSVGAELKIKAILVGHGAASDRLPEIAKAIAQTIFGRRIIRIPWAEVSVITDKIKLKSRADELGLGEKESVAFKLINALPGAWKK